ncbi:amino acid permease [Violaceomyces palustris]|uniref:Amino acid permease n=1 Tax=Violaceomyces palustris TaxID=1673888 RepID=A0ACD0NSK0_9BASI|nr:amino acid permease [Violaceomyces palustris]
MSTLLPVDGGFITLATRFVDEAVGMALGWNYFITQLALVCFELTALNVIIGYWDPNLNPAIMISVSLVILAAINLYSVRAFGEVEFWLSITKVFLMIGLFLFTFITMCGGNPIGDKFGFRYWKDPGPFASSTATGRAESIWSAICWSTFAIVGPDYISIVSGEVKNPRRVLPKAFNSVIYRIFFFYCVGSLCVGIVAPYNDSGLLGAISDGAPGAASSPYVIAMKRLGIKGLPDLVNVVILVSIFSTTNSFLYTGSRCLFGLAQAGQAPKVFLITNKQGTPWTCVFFCCVISCLSYLSLSAGTYKVLNWWINLVTCAQLITWSIIALTYIRFRAGLKAQGLLNTDFLPQRGRFQPFSGIYAMVWGPFALVFSGYYLFAPGSFTTVDFIFAYGSVLIFLALLIFWKSYGLIVRKGSRFGWIRAEEMDFKSDIDYFEKLTSLSEEKRASKQRSKLDRVIDFFF